MSNSLYYSHHLLSKPKKCFKKGQKVSKSQDPQPINPASLLTASLPVPLELSEASEKKTFSNSPENPVKEEKLTEVPKASLPGHVQVEAPLS